MRILLTGGAGAIGAYVLQDLSTQGISTTVLDVRKPLAPFADVPFVQCDLNDLEDTLTAIRGYDVVIHLAAIPHPYDDPPDRVVGVNTVSTFNVLEAVRQNGIPRIVYGCSESASGFGIHNVEFTPLYLPIDEAHPSWPHESYSLSKWFGERMVENYARAYAIQGISLRYCWVWLERNREAVSQIVQASARGESGPKPWYGCYIAPHDVAQACRRAALFDIPSEQRVPFEAFYLCAGTTFHPIPTLEALSRHYSPLPEIRDPSYFESAPFAPTFDTRKAQRLLGFKPTHSWQTFMQWAAPTG